jgi:hypothetical protein
MSRYMVYVVPDEFPSIKRLPGNVRQRVTRAIDELADNSRLPHSKQLEIAEVEGAPGEVRRLRIDNWRVVNFGQRRRKNGRRRGRSETTAVRLR